MNCCNNTIPKYQDFPLSGKLADNINLSLSNLAKRLKKDNGTVYCYIVKSVKNINGILQQKGCGPNWQGGVITLCTCKHFLRTFKDNNDWPGTWIAGFTSSREGDGSNCIVYLTKIEKSFTSHHDLWYFLPPEIRKEKDTNRNSNIFGDLYKPKNKLQETEKYNPEKYYPPCDFHVHFNGWQNDVNYSRNDRYASLFYGKVDKSFIWNSPLLKTSFRLHRGQKKLLLSDLVVNYLWEA